MKIDVLVNDAISRNADLDFTYVNVGSGKVSRRSVRPVEVISGDVLVAIDLDKGDYRRFAFGNMSNVVMAD